MTEKEMQDQAMNALLLGLGPRPGVLRARRTAVGYAEVDTEGGTTFRLRIEVLGSMPTPPPRSSDTGRR